MSDEILDKFERLRELRDWLDDVGESFADQGVTGRDVLQKRGEIDALAAELEEWARNAQAGETLDRVCSGWLHRHADEYPIVCVTDPGAAMELLLAMANGGHLWRIEFRRAAIDSPHMEGYVVDWSPGNFELLDIARACAVLAARGIKRGEQ